MNTSSAPGLPNIGPRQQVRGRRTRPMITSSSRLLFGTPKNLVKHFLVTDAAGSPTELPQERPFAHSVLVDYRSKDCSADNCEETSSPEDSKSDVLIHRSPVEYDDKIASMLAATAALKSQTSITTLPTSIYRTVHKTATKQQIRAIDPVCNAATRKIWKNKSPELAKRSLCQDDELVSAREQLTTIELRVNEGNNLNRRKVQKIVGSSIKRKPVYSQIQDKRRVLLDISHNSQEAASGPQTIDQPYSSLELQHPFDEETDFDGNLSDGLLSERPSGASTPRTSMSKVQMHDVDDGDHGKLTCSVLEHEVYSQVFKENKLKNSNSINEEIAPKSAQEGRRVKKHPSPSKKALEDLEAAFAIYARLKPLQGGDETGELATDNREILSSTDRNRLLRHSHAKRGSAKTKHRTARNNAYRARHSLPYRPTQAGSHEIDEFRN
ncbi:hypothetical protein PWT90_01473 [Aphanocladium album]|nr:hypothetical protein PWT90_01473 [Aphanocladium album]